MFATPSGPPESTRQATHASSSSDLEHALEAFFDRVFGPGSGAAHARRAVWQYQGEARALGAHLEVLRYQGQPIGTLGSLPERLFVQGERHESRFTADLGADPAWRNRGIGARLLRAFAQGSGVPVAFSVSPDAHAVLTRMGFEEVSLQPLFRVLRTEGLLERRLKLELRDGRLGPMLRAASRLVDASESTWSPLVNRLYARRQHLPPWQAPSAPRVRLEVRPITGFASTLDPLTEDIGQAWPLVFSPDARALSVRYDQHPFHRYQKWLLTRNGVPAGYAVWRVFQEADGLLMATLMTLQVAMADPRGTQLLLRTGLDALRREGVFAVRALGSHPFLHQALLRERFFPHGSSPGLLFLPRNDAERSWRDLPWWIGFGTSDAEVG